MSSSLFHVPNGKFSRPIFFFGWILIAIFSAVIVFDAVRDIRVSSAEDQSADLSASTVSSSQINLLWSGPQDKTRVVSYKIFRGGEQIGTAPLTNYQDTGLAQNTAYSYFVEGFDAAGNALWQSSRASAVTELQVTQISILEYKITNLTKNSATVSWETNIPSVGSINYSVSQSNLTNRKTSLDLSMTHSITLSDLKANTKYYYRIKTIGGSTASQSRLLNFRTLR